MIDILTAAPKGAKPGLSIHLHFEGGDLARLGAPARADGFAGKKEQSFYEPAERRLSLGLGKEKEAGLDAWRKAGLQAARKARELKVAAAELQLPAGANREQAGALAEGAWLGLYKFTEGKGKPTAGSREAAEAKGAEFKRLILRRAPAGSEELLREKKLACAAVCLARDLVNRAPGEKYPAKYARDVQAQARGIRGLKVRVLDKKAIAAWPMAGLLAVNQGSVHPPVFVHMSYKPAGRARRRVALVGKGVTFDSGGLSLKPASSMNDMKCDMAGSAVALSLCMLAARLRLPVEVHACAPLTENLPGGNAVKIGDIVRYKNGKTAEILNTDAEGRVILADALLYAESLKPDVILDFATLTGAAIYALGMNITALMGDDKLCEKFKALGQKTGESFWQLPLPESYRSHIESKVADIKNIGNSGEAGSMAGAFYLKEFVSTKAWVHFDIAGPAFLKSEEGVHPAGGTGIPLRTVLEYLKSL